MIVKRCPLRGCGYLFKPGTGRTFTHSRLPGLMQLAEQGKSITKKTIREHLKKMQLPQNQVSYEVCPRCGDLLIPGKMTLLNAALHMDGERPIHPEEFDD